MSRHIDHFTAFKGLLSTIVTSAGITTSLMQQVEAWLRLASLGVGIAVGVLTIRSLIKNR